MVRCALVMLLAALCANLSAAAQLQDVSVQSNPVAAGSYETINFQIRNVNGQAMVYGIALSTDAAFNSANEYGNVWLAYSGGFYGVNASLPGYWQNQPQGVLVSTGATDWLPESVTVLIPVDAPASLYLHVMATASTRDLGASPDAVLDIPMSVTGSHDPQWDLQMKAGIIDPTFQIWQAKVINRGIWPVSTTNLKIFGWVDEPVAVKVGGDIQPFSVFMSDGVTFRNTSSGATFSFGDVALSSCPGSRLANRQVAADLSSLGGGITIPGGGGYAQSNSNLGRIQRTDGATLSGLWYSNIALDSGWTDDPYFALYFNNQLVCETSGNGLQDPNTGQAPCGITGCGPHTPSPTYTISPTFTPSPTVSPTPSITDTITAGSSPTESPTFTQTLSFSVSPTTSCTRTPSWSSTVSPSPSDSPTSSGSLTYTGTFTSTPTLGNITSTDTPNATSTRTDTLTFTGTPSSSATASPTTSATPTISISPSFSASPTLSVTPSSSMSPTPIGTPTATPSFTASPSISATPAHWHAKLLLAPVPVTQGGMVQLFVPAQTLSGDWEVYNVAGQRVSSLTFGGSTQAWNTQRVAAGIYLVHVKVAFDQGGQGEIWQKVAVVR